MKKPTILGSLKEMITAVTQLNPKAGRAYREHILKAKIIHRNFPELTFEEAEELAFNLSEETNKQLLEGSNVAYIKFNNDGTYVLTAYGFEYINNKIKNK